jgi:iron complex transport system permease protein
MKPTPSTRLFVLFSCAVLFVAAALGCPLIGPTSIHLKDALQNFGGSGLDAQVLFGLRLPRVAMALLTGAALASSGVAFQALLRNPLADPFTLGLAGGSSLGAVSILLFFPAWAAHSGVVPAAAFAGSLLSVGLVYVLAGIFQNPQPSENASIHSMALLLSGVTVNYFFSAVLLVMYYLVDFTRSLSLLRWILGGLDAVEPSQVLTAFWPAALSFLTLLILAPSLNLLSAGDDLAQTKGVDTKRISLFVFLIGSLLTSSVTAFTGPIGFIGLMAPNLLRRLIGYDHRWLLPSSALLGGAFLAFADTFARTCFAPAELPVGALTALLGGPLFLLILFRPKKWFSFK